MIYHIRHYKRQRSDIPELVKQVRKLCVLDRRLDVADVHVEAYHDLVQMLTHLLLVAQDLSLAQLEHHPVGFVVRDLGMRCTDPVHQTSHRALALLRGSLALQHHKNQDQLVVTGESPDVDTLRPVSDCLVERSLDVLDLHLLAIVAEHENLKGAAQDEEDPPDVAGEGRQLGAGVSEGFLLEDAGGRQAIQDNLLDLILVVSPEGQSLVAHARGGLLFQLLRQIHGIGDGDEDQLGVGVLCPLEQVVEHTVVLGHQIVDLVDDHHQDRSLSVLPCQTLV